MDTWAYLRCLAGSASASSPGSSLAHAASVQYPGPVDEVEAGMRKVSRQSAAPSLFEELRRVGDAGDPIPDVHVPDGVARLCLRRHRRPWVRVTG